MRERTAESIPASPMRQALAVGISAALGIVVALLVRGRESDYGLILHGHAGGLARDAAAMLFAALTVGFCAPMIAGNYVSGLPARALCCAWAGIALSQRVARIPEETMTGEYWTLLAGAEAVLLLGCVWVTTTTCWLVDTRLTFPRRYPDPADRPAAKHTRGPDILHRLLPHAAGIGLAVGGVTALVRRFEDPALTALFAAGTAALGTWTMQRLRPARGSIWTMAGVLGGVGGGTLFGGGDAGPPPTVPAQLLSCALAGYAALLARGLRRRAA